MSGGLAIIPRDSNDAFSIAQKAVESKLFSNFRSPEEAFIVILTGAEYGVTPMRALRGFHVINGKACPSADFLASLVLASGKCKEWEFVERTDERVTLQTLRAGSSRPSSSTWTIERAVKAGVTNNPTWKKYPAQMLSARAIAELARQVYPDVCAGMYTPDEMESPSQEAPQRVEVTVVAHDPDDFDPEREAIETEGASLVDRMLSCGTLEGLSELGKEAASLKKGSKERVDAVAAMKQRRAQIEAATTGAAGE